MAANEPIIDPQVAIRTIRDEHDRLAELTMHLVDLISIVQAGKERVNPGRLRQATGHMLRKSAIDLQASLACLTPDRDVAEIALGEVLLQCMVEAEAPRDDDIVELCERRMPARFVETVA